MSGFSSPATSKMSITSSGASARETICRTALSSSSGLLWPVGVVLAGPARTAWKAGPRRPDSQRVAGPNPVSASPSRLSLPSYNGSFINRTPWKGISMLDPFTSSQLSISKPSTVSPSFV